MSETKMLSDMMKTRYIIQSLAGRFRDCMEECKNNSYVVDLSGCRFGPDCAYIMSQYYDKVDFISTENDFLNSILQNNCEVSRQVIPDYERLDLTKYKSLDDVISLISSLPSGSTYEPTFDFADARGKAALVLLILSRPDIEFDIRKCAVDVFDFVRGAWVNYAEHHDSYWEVVAPNVVSRYPDEKGNYGDKIRGFYKEYDYVHNRLVLPKEFGSEQIVKLDENQHISTEWLQVVTKCCDVFDTIENTTRVKGKTVKDFLTFRKEN